MYNYFEGLYFLKKGITGCGVRFLLWILAPGSSIIHYSPFSSSWRKTCFVLHGVFQLSHLEKLIKCIFRIICEIYFSFLGTQILISQHLVYFSLTNSFSHFMLYFTISILTLQCFVSTKRTHILKQACN